MTEAWISVKLKLRGCADGLDMRCKGKTGVKSDTSVFGVTGRMGLSQRHLCRAKPGTLSFGCRFICGGLDRSLMKTMPGGTKMLSMSTLSNAP